MLSSDRGYLPHGACRRFARWRNLRGVLGENGAPLGWSLGDGGGGLGSEGCGLVPDGRGLVGRIGVGRRKLLHRNLTDEQY